MSEHWWVLDRFEGDVAVILSDSGRVWNLPRWMLPPEAGEGAHLSACALGEADGARTLRVAVDVGATAAARAEARGLAERLRARGASADGQSY